MSRPISLFSSSLRASSSLRRPISALPRAPIRFLATPSTGPQTVSSGPIKTPHPLDASTKSNQDEGSRHIGEQSPESAAAVKATQAWPDYSKGPSALDKASQLFFFTEIVRGKFSSSISCCQAFQHDCEYSTDLKECGSCLNSSSDHHIRSCTLSRRDLYHPDSEVNMLYVDTPTERSDVSVSSYPPCSAIIADR